MKLLKSIFIGLLPIFLTIIGVLSIVYGEIDDSPGLMLIGFILIVFASILTIRQSRKD